MLRPIPIPLDCPPNLCPPVFRALQSGVSVEIESEKFIQIQGEKFVAQKPLAVGKIALVKLGMFNAQLFYQNELDAHADFMRQKMAEEQRQIELKKLENQTRRAKEADEFWHRHKIPFKFSLDIKEVLSGLSINSSGDGYKSNTVLHVFLHEPFSDGRLARKKGDFLCSNSVSKWGGNWSGSAGENDNEFSNGVRNVPTCKRCLEILSRFAD